MLNDYLSLYGQVYSKISILITSVIIFSVSFILITLSIITQPQQLSYAHLYGNRTQEWINTSDGIKIQFTYQPEKPIIDAFTELKFSVQNLTTGDHIKNLSAKVVVTNGQRLFKFENLTVPAGDFSVKYIFPDDGTHQVITRIYEKNSAILASFNVFVPHQPLPSILNPFPSSQSGTNENDVGIIASKVMAILLPAVAVVAIIYILKKAGKSKQGKIVKE
jgi:plastocyanin